MCQSISKCVGDFYYLLSLKVEMLWMNRWMVQTIQMAEEETGDEQQEERGVIFTLSSRILAETDKTVPDVQLSLKLVGGGDYFCCCFCFQE